MTATLPGHRFQVVVRAKTKADAKKVLDVGWDPKEVQVKAGLPELWGATEVGEHLGIAYQNLYRLSGYGLPEPAVVLNRGRLWLADDVKSFAAGQARRKAAKNWMKGQKA